MEAGCRKCWHRARVYMEGWSVTGNHWDEYQAVNVIR
jgi:hypothetical protein